MYGNAAHYKLDTLAASESQIITPDDYYLNCFGFDPKLNKTKLDRYALNSTHLQNHGKL